MKETIYSIPINESFSVRDGACPVCRLHDKLTADSLEYTLGAAMMDPDVRERTNRQGFCPRHLTALLSKGNRLPLALVLETHLRELRENPALPETAESCYVCNRTDGFMRAYYANILHLWRTQPEFAALFDGQDYLCRPHLAGLFAAAERDLPKKEKAAFSAVLTAKAGTILKELEESLEVFAKSFDHRYADGELGGHRFAIERAAAFLSGIPKSGTSPQGN